MIAYERVVDAFREQGLHVKDNGHGKAYAQAPGHSSADRSVSIMYVSDGADGKVVLYGFAGETAEDICTSVGLNYPSDLYDNRRDVTYQYPDGKYSRRSAHKKFFSPGEVKGGKLFQQNLITDATDEVHVCEGEQDAIALTQHLGVVAVSARSGAGSAHLADYSALTGKNVVVWQDKDEAGRKRGKTVSQILEGVAASVKLVEAGEGCKDAADHVAAGLTLNDISQVHISEKAPLVVLLEKALAAAQELPTEDVIAGLYKHLGALNAGQAQDSGLRDFSTLIPEFFDWLNAPPEQVRTIATPWPELDDILSGGLHPGRSYLFAGRPGGGKSLALSNIAAYAGVRGHKGALFSVEMGTMEIVARIMAAGGQAEYGQITRRQLDERNWVKVVKYADEARDMELKICDKSPITIEQITAMARKLKHTEGLDFVAVDYVQLLKASDTRLSRERQIADISWGLKMMAKELDVAVVSACQLNRGATKEKRPPTIAELRESGSLEQDSDVVVLIHHELNDNQPTGEVEFIVGKNRTGPLTTITLDWRGYQARIG
ncbi:DnaB-like helicase C-terminal domain-containing protein [Nocardia sp. CA-135953]|uniref:DnaB-like helicase C-terminal domain-containing protein n=1 Tax=Nocardia sp. CA-135953 TaxID=3239978 RepID=UPI003D99A8F4